MDFDPEVVKFLAMMREAKVPSIDQLSVREARMMYTMQADRLGGPTVEMEQITELKIPGCAPDALIPASIPMRLYRPEGVPITGAPLLLYFHGGGWMIGGIETHDKLCRQIADRTACLVLSVRYRLAPEDPAPAAAEDAIAVLGWLAAHAATIGADPDRLAVGGDSAGGNLAAVVAIAAQDRELPLRAQILIYPSVDLRQRATYPSRRANADVPPLTRAVIDYFFDKYVPDAALLTDWRISPITVSDASGLAPALVIVAERDALRDEGLAYADLLEAAGVPVERLEFPGMIHGFITLFGALSAASHAVDAIAKSLRFHFR